MSFSLSNIDHVHIYVSNRDKAESWYKDILRRERVKEYEFWATDGGPLTIANGGVHLALFEGDRVNENAVAFCVSKLNFDKFREHLKAKGVKFRFSDHQLSLSIYFNDPEGNQYEVTTYELCG